MRRINVTSPAYIREREAIRIGYLYRDALKEAVTSAGNKVEVTAAYQIYMTDVAGTGWIDHNVRVFTTEHIKLLKPQYEKYEKEFKVTSIDETVKYVINGIVSTSYYEVSRQIIIDKNYKIEHQKEIERIRDEIVRTAVVHDAHAQAYFTIPKGSFAERYHFTNINEDSEPTFSRLNRRMVVLENDILETVITLLVNKTSIKEIYNVDMNNLYTYQGAGIVHIHVKPNEHYWSFENAKD